MRLRWILPPLALLSLGAVAWVGLHGKRTSPQSLLDSARERLARRPSDPSGALRELDEALRIARAEAYPELRAELLQERADLYRAQGLAELALADCRTRLAELGEEATMLALANELCLWLGDPSAALDFATRLGALDPLRAQSRIGRCRVALADAPLARIERLARVALPRDDAAAAVLLAQRSAVFSAQKGRSTAALDELLELFPAPENRRQVGELVAEAAEHLQAARAAFVHSLEPATTVDAIAGLQDLLIRGGADLEVAELGLVALTLPKLASPLPVLARTASTLVRLGRDERARSLILELRARAPDSLRPETLPSNDLRDELEEWCFLVADLGLWGELRSAATEFLERCELRREAEKAQLASFLLGIADLRENRLASAQRTLEKVSAFPPRQRDVPVRTWLALAELAGLQKQAAQARQALLLATKDAPLDPPEPLRAELGLAWLRLAEMQRAEGDSLQADISLTHALRCSVRSAAEIEPLWHSEGRKTLGKRSAAGPYALFIRARGQLDRELYGPALEDARTLLSQFPGLGPALEIASKASFRLRNYSLAIEVALEMLERGWPSPEASARLRAVPAEYFLPADRVRWMRLDPRGSLDSVLARLLEQGQGHGAALAALAGNAKFQPPEVIALSASAVLAVGDAASAHDIFALLAPDSPAFRASAGLVLRAAAERARGVDDSGLTDTVSRVIASTTAEDPELVGALDLLLSGGRTAEAEGLLAWLAPQPTAFLGEVLLRASALRAVRGSAEDVDEDLERASGLLEPGRPDLGRLCLAADRGAVDELEREARRVLGTAWGQEPARHLVLSILAGELERAAHGLRGARLDGRDALLDFGAAWLGVLAPAELVEGDGETTALPTLSAALVEGVAAQDALLIALACDAAPWASWSLARLAEWPEALQGEPWPAVLRALALTRLGDARRALAELEPLLAAPSAPPEAWGLAARLNASLAGPEAALPWELGWMAAAGLGDSDDPALARLQAETLLAGGERDAAQQRLEEALRLAPDEPRLLSMLARVEDVPGRRTHAIRVYGTLFQGLTPGERAPFVLPLLAALRAARDAGEIGEERWWTEVEALEAELPSDPAPPRELAERAFERPASGVEFARTLALERLNRFRERTLQRPVEALRPGEARRWTRLLARFTPERAVRFAREELEADPSNPEVWRAEAEALLAAEHWQEALATLDTVLALAPERDTARLSALTSFHVRDDPADYLARLRAIERIDRSAGEDPLLSFYRAIATLRTDAQAADRAVAEGLALWEQRAEHGMDEPRHGRAFARALYGAGKVESALQILLQSLKVDGSELESDVVKALAYLMRATPAKQRRQAAAAQADEAAADGAAPASVEPSPVPAAALPEETPERPLLEKRAAEKRAAAGAAEKPE